MRNVIVLIGTLLISGTISSATRAQDAYSIVYDLYYELMQYPENGNGLIVQNENIFGDRFYSCLGELTQNYMGWAQDHYKYCDVVYTDPKLQAKRYQENEPAKSYNALRELGPATRNQVRWSDTNVANAAVMVKKLIGPDLWFQTIRTAMPPQRSFMLCR